MGVVNELKYDIYFCVNQAWVIGRRVGLRNRSKGVRGF